MPQHQISMVLDLNKCLGCQTCTMACKKLWTDGDGMDYMYWNNVETRPGQGYPRNWDKIGGGFEATRLFDGFTGTQRFADRDAAAQWLASITPKHGR